MNRRFDFVTSDLHLDHSNIVEVFHRPFPSIEEHNEQLIDRWNSVVGSRDHVVVLGDVCMGTIANSLPLVDRLNGTKDLILGNHDRPFPRGRNPERWYREYGNYFNDIRIHGYAEIARRMVELNHFPYSGDHTDEDRYTDFRPVDNGNILMHGHLHADWQVSYTNRSIHVGVDAWDYTPVSYDQIEDIVRNMPV